MFVSTYGRVQKKKRIYENNILTPFEYGNIINGNVACPIMFRVSACGGEMLLRVHFRSFVTVIVDILLWRAQRDNVYF